MKKGSSFFTSLLVAVVTLLSFSGSQAFANGNYNDYSRSLPTVVRGNVYDFTNGDKGIGGVTVYISCTNNRHTTTESVKTNRNGLYTVTFSQNQCKAYDSVSASVMYKGQTQNDSVNVSKQRTATMDFCFGSVTVPEFGLIPGMFAAIASLGLFFSLRKKLS